MFGGLPLDPRSFDLDRGRLLGIVRLRPLANAAGFEPFAGHRRERRPQLGRNFDEVLRLLDSCQLTAKHQVATPVNWKPGEDVIIAGSVSDEQAREKYPGGWKAPKPYLRIVSQPH